MKFFCELLDSRDEVRCRKHTSVEKPSERRDEDNNASYLSMEDKWSYKLQRCNIYSVVYIHIRSLV